MRIARLCASNGWFALSMIARFFEQYDLQLRYAVKQFRALGYSKSAVMGLLRRCGYPI